jgi:cytochrome d ubiquinol oxidase subunit I
VWIVIANSWMQTPAGYHLEKMGPNGEHTRLPVDYILKPEDLTSVRAVVDDFWAMVLNPSSMDRLTHTVLGAWMAGAFLVLSISAFYLLRKRHTDFATASLKVGLVFASVATMLQMISGDSTAKSVVRNQPIKLASIEGVYRTEPYTPLTLFGYVDPKTQQVHGPQIPGMLSFLCFMDFQKPVTGLNELPTDEFLLTRHPGATPEQLPVIRKTYWPIVPVVFQTYHLMIAIGGACLGLVVTGLFFWWKGWLFDTDRPLTRWYLIALVFSVLGPQIANQAGWLTAELGRQPWIVYGLLKTSQGLSKVVSANQIIFSLVLFAMVYVLLFAVFIYLLTRKIQHGPDSEEESEELPESWQQMVVVSDKEPRA